MLLKITLKCFSLRVILNLLNQVVNVNAMWSFHHRFRHAWDVEVNECSPHRLQGWTCSRSMMHYHDVRENQILALCVCLHLISQVSPFYRELAWRDWLHYSRVSPFYLKNQVLLANTYQQSLVNRTCFLSPRVSPFDHRLDWVWIGLVWKIQHEVLLKKTVEQAFQLADVQL